MFDKTSIEESAIEREPNVPLIGWKPYKTLPTYCKGFDVAVIPFPISEVTLNVNPLKAREYLAAELPVVSTAIPEVEAHGACGIAGSAGEFFNRMADPQQRFGPDDVRNHTMASEGWSARVEQLRVELLKLPPTRL